MLCHVCFLSQAVGWERWVGGRGGSHRVVGWGPSWWYIRRRLVTPLVPVCEEGGQWRCVCCS